MLLCKNSAIKLFGTTIPLQPDEGLPVPVLSEGSESSGEDEKDYRNDKGTTFEHKDQVAQASGSQEDEESLKSENLKLDSSATEDAKATDSITEDNPVDSSNSNAKTLKKPDKILPCPRCSSMETKFCYYNNYNVNQPRHFCKSCQRYWTAGGTMRNVPVGAGRRKSKNSAVQYRELTICISKSQAVSGDIVETIPYSIKPNGSVLSFGSDKTLSTQMSSVLNHTEKTLKRFNPSYCSTENGHAEDSRESDARTCAVTPCINGIPWPYPWAPIAAFSTPSIAVPLYPATYWNCALPSSAWNVASISPMTSSSIDNCSKGQEAKIISLGKHSRDGNPHDTSLTSVPKTMRIADPQETVKSSLRTLIDHKKCEGDATKDLGFLRAFHNKIEIKKHATETSQILHSNPAALARSVAFQES